MVNIIECKKIYCNWRATKDGAAYDVYEVGVDGVVTITEIRNGYQAEFDDGRFELIYNINRVFLNPVM